jgi:hypothetical protein
MDPKTYEQVKAINESLKIQQEAEAKALEAARKPAPRAEARPSAPRAQAPAKPAAPKVVAPVQVGAPVKQTKASAASVVTPPVTDATRKSKVDDDLRQDLKLEDLYRNVGMLPPTLEAKERVNASIRALSAKTGLEPQRYKELAAIQGVDLNDLDQKAREGMPFENYRKAKEGAIGFVPADKRVAMFEDLAKDYETAEQGKIRTDKRIDLAAAKEARGTVPGLTTGYVVGGTTSEETPEVAKSGEHYYAVAEAYLKAVDKDPEVVRLVNLYGNSLASGATQKYINDRAQQLLKNKGITPSSPDAERLASLARRQALYEVLARKTVGQWTPGIFVKDVQVTDDAAAPGLFAAMAPNIELIGFNSKGDAVFRQESAAGMGLRLLDVVGVVPIPGKKLPVPIPGQSLLAGMLTKGENETYYEAASRGAQTGANWLEVALDATEGQSLPMRGAAGLVGLAGSMVHPDVTAAAGALGKAGKAYRVARINKAIAREAEPILKELVTAYQARNFDKAAELEKKLATSPTLGPRGAKGHGVVKAYNRGDIAFAQALASINPALKHLDPFLVDNLVAMVGRRGDDALTEFVYEAAGKGSPHMHFGAAAPEIAERTKEGVGTSFETYLNSGNFDRRIERIKMARDAYAKTIPKTADEALAKTFNDAVERVKGRLVDARLAQIPESELQKEIRLLQLMEEHRAALMADPKSWMDKDGLFHTALRNDPITGGDANSTWRQRTYLMDVDNTARRVNDLKSRDFEALKARDLQMFDDALEAVETNIQSRMMSAESLRRNLADKAELRITPIDILDKEMAPGTERLSPYAQASFLVTARQFSQQEMDRKSLLQAYQMLDKAFEGVASRHDMSLEDVWRDFFVKVEQGKVEMPGAGAAKAAGKPPPKPPAKLPAAPSDVPKLANVPNTPEVKAAVEKAAKKGGRARAPAAMHPRTADVVAGIPDEFKTDKLTPEAASKVMSFFSKLGLDAKFPEKLGGVDQEAFDAVRAYLMATGELELKGKKLVKVFEEVPAAPTTLAGQAAKVAPEAPRVTMQGLQDELDDISDDLAQVEADLATAREDGDDAALAELARAEENLLDRRDELAAQLEQAKAAPAEAPVPATAPTLPDTEIQQAVTEAKAVEAVAAKVDEVAQEVAPAEAVVEAPAPAAVEAPVKAAKPPRGKKAKAAAVPATATPVETATVDELQAAINNVDESLDEVAETIQRAEDDANEAQVTWLRGVVEKNLRERKAGLEARLTRLQAAAPRDLRELPPEVQAKVEDLAGGVYQNVVQALKQPDAVRKSPQAYADSYKDVLAEMWDSPYDFERAWPAMRDRVELSAANALDAVEVPATMENLGNRALWKNVKAKGRIGASTGMLEARVGTVEFRISTVPAAKEGNPPVFQVMARVGDEFENLGPKAGYATLEDALRALTPAGGKPAPLRSKIDSVISSGVRKASIPKKGAKQAKVVEEVAEEALDEAVPEQVARLEEAAPGAEEAPAVVPAPTMTGEQYRAKAVEELGKITHSVVKADGTKVYGVVEGDNFVPKYTLSTSEMRDPTDALYFKASRGSTAIDEPVALAKSGARPESLQATVKKIEKLPENALYQRGEVLVEADKLVGRLVEVEKGKIEFLTPEQIKDLKNQNDPTAIVTLFRGVADPTTLLHEGAHYIRRMGLAAEDMDAVTKWIRSQGVDVTHKFGNFDGTAEAVEQAEELFARAFEQYLLKGEAPEPQLTSLFQKVKEVFEKVYRTISTSPLGKDIDPDVKAVFDRLFKSVPQKKPESTFDLLMRHTFNNKGMEQEGSLTALAREAKRRGIPGATVEDLTKLMVDAGNKYGEGFLEQNVIEFPVPVLGKEKWTGADVLELDRRIQMRRNDLELAPLKQALFGEPEEEKATEAIFAALEKPKGVEEGAFSATSRTLARGLTHTVIGGDLTAERVMRNLPPEVRRSINTASNVIENGIGDAITVLSQAIRDGDMDFMYRYLSGETGMAYKTGRRVISSGHEFIGGFLDLYKNAGLSLTGEQRALLQKFAQAVNTRPNINNLRLPQTRSEALASLVFPDLDAIREAQAAEDLGKAPIRAAMQQEAKSMAEALEKFRELKGSDDQGVGSMLAKAMRGATEEGSEISINEFRFTETLLYLAGITQRDGKFFVEVGEDYSKAGLKNAAEILLREAQDIYGTAEDQLFARRVAILVGAYGSASRAKAELAELGLVLTAEERTAYNNWALGYGVTPEMRPRIEQVMRKLGANTTFEPDTILGADVYIPKQARERIADALKKAQFSEQKLTKMGDIYQSIFAFMKKRMTRGNFLLRQRYFMVNTIDHFFQMSLVVGYAPAFQSMSRIALQNALTSPFTGQALEMGVRAVNRLVPGAKIPPDVVEKIRDFFSRGGDKTAGFLREMMGGSKYRVEVNHVLEGRNTPIVIGGRVTTGKRLREIFVAEGILESYNTRRLGAVLRKEGTAFISDGDGIIEAGINDRSLGGNVTTAWARVKDAAIDLSTDVVDDIGDAWAERERVGAAVTLIENGYEPRVACRLTIDALYDYAQSMTKMDRNWFVGLLFPFWAFQKNANQQFINVIATPYGAYRMMVMKRFRDRSSELLTELYYDEVGGELGLDVNSMPQDMQDMYYAVMTKAHEVYGDEIPENAKMALRMGLTGRASEVLDGKYYELDADLIRMLRSGGIGGVGGAGMSDYLMPTPSKSILPSYMRERPGVFLAPRRDAAVRLYSGLRAKNDEMFYLMLPPASFEDAFKHTATVMSTALLMGANLTAMTPAGPLLGLEARGLEGTKIAAAIRPVLDLERSPIAGPVIGMYAERGYPQKLHPLVASFIMNTTDAPILRVPAVNDPFEGDNFMLEMQKLTEEGKEADIAQILGADYVRTVQELNSKELDPNEISTVRDEHFYLPPGGYSIAFENAPLLGELNKELLLKYGKTAQEKAASSDTASLGNLLYILRNATGLEVASVSASRTAQQEEPVFYTKSRKPF